MLGHHLSYTKPVIPDSKLPVVNTLSFVTRPVGSTVTYTFGVRFRQMGTPLENFQQQYAAEVLKVDADEGLLKRLERGIRGLKGSTESTG